MNKILTLIISTMFLVSCTPQTNKEDYSYHLEKAEEALTKIEDIISNNPQAALIPVARADSNDDQAILDNAETANEEISNAQEKVDSMGDEAAQGEAQSEVSKTKKHAENTFDAAKGATNDPETQNELDNLKEKLGNIEPTPYEPAKASDNDPGNTPDDGSMSANPNGANENDALADDDPAEEAPAEAEAARGGPEEEPEDGECEAECDDDEGNADNQANYDAFKAKTGVDFKPIYEGTADSPFDKPAEDMLQDAERDLQDRAKVDEPGQLEAPVLDQAAIERAMQELTQ